jgi:penicillin-binding protein 1C
MPNACNHALKVVLNKIAAAHLQFLVRRDVVSKKVTRTLAKVAKMPRNYARKINVLPAKPKVKYVRKRYAVTALPAKRLTVPAEPMSLLTKLKVFGAGGVFTLLFVVTPAMAYGWYRGLPQPGVLVENANTHKPTRIVDRKGVPLYEIYVDKKYAPVALSQIPKTVIFATLAVEDHEFFNHHGVRMLSIARAAKATLVDDSLQGGSTITQQLIKNVLLSPEQTITRKLKEVFLALVVEKKYTKEEILELYLNNIPYGGTAWGIQSAAQKFFGKDVGELTLGESAFLAGLPSSPSSYVSYASDIDLARSRQKLVLDRMEELKIISADQKTAALAQELHFVQQAEYIKAPHFVHYVRKELEKTYGRTMVESGGLTVKTSLDLDLQTRLQELVAEEIAKSGTLNIGNGAVIVIDPKTGEILAYVGSVDYFKAGWGAYDVITAARQPGSAIKVVTYALALERGYTPASPIVDAPLTIQLGGGQSYRPVNYDGSYHGTVTLRSALANSYNIPAVKLVKEVGTDAMVTLGNKMGLTSWQVDDSYGYSVTLGGKETRLLDLANVYATLARGGTYRPTTPFISIKDANGFELYSTDRVDQEQVVSAATAYMLSSILSDNTARTPAFGSRSLLVIPNRTVAVKTGTTNEKRDNYTLGYTPSYVVGVWVGNNDNTPMHPYLASGVSGAAPIWHKAMQLVLEGTKDEQFSVPADVFVKIDSACGRSEVFAKGSKMPNLCPEEHKDSQDKAKQKD